MRTLLLLTMLCFVASPAAEKRSADNLRSRLKAEPRTSIAEGKRLPNVVVIFADDLGYGDIGTYGATGYKTPHLDELARTGRRFTSFYAAQAVCSASRAVPTTSVTCNIGIPY